jgi:hypothetical protein
MMITMEMRNFPLPGPAPLYQIHGMRKRYLMSASGQAIMKSATSEQQASIATLTAGVLDAARRALEAAISNDARPELAFDCLIKPISR